MAKSFFGISTHRLRVSRRIEVKLIKRYLDAQAGDTICDIGSGDGFWTPRISGSARTTGIDIDWTASRDARHRSGEANARVVLGTAEAMPFPDHHFDKIYGLCSVEHIADIDSAFTEFHRCLKPGGVLALTVDSLTHPATTDEQRKRHHEKYFTPHLFDLDTMQRRLESRGFSLTDHRFIVATALGDLLYRAIERNYRIQYPLFPILYPLLALSDTFFSRNRYGWKLAVRAVKNP